MMYVKCEFAVFSFTYSVIYETGGMEFVDMSETKCLTCLSLSDS